MPNSIQALTECFVTLMERLSTQRRMRSREKWNDLGLTMPQARTLFYLSRGPRRMSELAEYLDREMSSTTSMIDRLVKNNLVSRVEDASDRRVVTCILTANGEAVVKRFFELGRMRNESIGGMLTKEELEIIVPALKVLTDAIERGDSESGSETSLEEQGVRQAALRTGS